VVQEGAAAPPATGGAAGRCGDGGAGAGRACTTARPAGCGALGERAGGGGRCGMSGPPLAADSAKPYQDLL